MVAIRSCHVGTTKLRAEGETYISQLVRNGSFAVFEHPETCGRTTLNTTVRASAIVLVPGVFCGVYWVPVRAIADLGLVGAWGTGEITLAAKLFLLPSVVE